MTALASSRNTVQRGVDSVTDYVTLPVKANVKIHQGALIVVDAGYAAPGRVALSLVAVGRADEAADNTGGAAGAISVKVRRGTFKWANGTAGDAIVQADVGKNCFVLDDQTVAKTDGTGARSVAGKVWQIEDGQVWVETL
jgi:hypothetical protein